MATLQTTALRRRFRYQALDLPDPDPAASPEEVKRLLAATHPALLSASIDGPALEDGAWVYTFKRAVGTKG